VPSVSVHDGGVEWEQSTEADSIQVGQKVGARVTLLDDGRAIPSVLFSVGDDGELNFQRVLSECAPNAPIGVSKNELSAALAGCDVIEVVVDGLVLGDAICYPEE
jgi:hypothetical protein